MTYTQRITKIGMFNTFTNFVMEIHEMPAHNTTDEKHIRMFLRPTSPLIFLTLHLRAGVLSCFSRV